MKAVRAALRIVGTVLIAALLFLVVMSLWTGGAFGLAYVADALFAALERPVRLKCTDEPAYFQGRLMQCQRCTARGEHVSTVCGFIPEDLGIK